ncbi:flagellar biosynthesis protein FlhA [Treponema primitia ZAS-2]|uniref:Flagellar biosynthesis protein FlhA n=1 Tax=Treponema primitia (strain ATCC BAA-887 / DSM 12427 / ZAS-2) TaxID=545694 RepID=F5YPU6_TREPZ|nr:flagellar biosynthesis protein FlhA [Treponema primitia]AEF85823.1 flagellar biosynthesis protein FlhA [Treponema primitia ZAS-2]
MPNNLFGNRTELFMAVAVVAVVMMLIIPLPTILLDALMAMNLVLALLILLIVLYTRKATDFSIFPTILLVSTVFSLALNVSSTRLILTKGSSFDGRMVRAFSSFVVGSGGTEGLVVGAVIFVVIIAVQAMVITKGATRIAEVAARFALDALPGKQMAIEAEYNSQAITEEEAIARKNDLQREVDFYGAMDGSSKFISGNVKVGILITVVNVIGGFIIGMVIHGEPPALAISNYIAFAIGDGLLSQFPALLISTATGIIVTRSVSNGTFGEDVSEQFTRDARIYWIGAVALGALALLPGFPWYVLLPMAGLLVFMAIRLGRRQTKRDTAAAKTAEAKKAKPETEDMSPIVPLDPLSLELGYGLIPLVDREKGAELLERVHRIRRESGLDLGLVIPQIRIIDNIRLEPSEYCFKIQGVDVGRGKIRMGYYLCINPGGVKDELPGEKTRDPTFGLPALWVNEDKRDEAERAGYTVVDPPSIIATHLTDIIKRHAAEILGRQATQKILDTLKKDYPAVVEEAQKVLSLGEIQKVLQSLLREQVSIRNMVAILEALADYGQAAKTAKNMQFLVEKARQALSRQICLQFATDDRVLRVLTINQALEQKILDSAVETASGVISAMDPPTRMAWIKSLSRAVAAVQDQGWYPVILCSEAARYLVKSSSDRELPNLVVLSIPEIVPDISVEAVGEIKIESEVDGKLAG